MKEHQQSRRAFLKQSSIGALGLTILPWSMKGVAPSDTLRVAHIGVGGMGNSHIKWFANLPEVKIVALCDVDQTHLASSLHNLAVMQADWKVDTYEDFRHILDRPFYFSVGRHHKMMNDTDLRMKSKNIENATYTRR